jgi:CRP/FNR family transcriptional regulator, cyclic AMP receptor protein
MSTHDEIAQALAGVPLLKKLHGHHRLKLAQRVSQRRYKTGDVVVRAGDTSMSFYVVLSGSIEFRLESASGRPMSLDPEGSGACFGEMDLLEDLPRAATVVALEDCEMALLTKWDFEDELRKDPEIALALLPVLTRRIRELDGRLTRLAAEAAAAGAEPRALR